MHPVNLVDNQPSGAKTTFHTHQHSLVGMEKGSLEDSQDDTGLFTHGRSHHNNFGCHVGPQTSSSQMIFGKRPPEARGKRNKILSAGGSANTFYKSAMLANVNRGQNQDASLLGTGSGTTAAGGASSNLHEFYSPRPPNNNGVGELRTSESGEKTADNIN